MHIYFIHHLARRFGAAEPAVTRSLIQVLGEVGSLAVSDDRRAACARHLRLVLEDAKQETSQPAYVQAVLEDGTAALRALDADQDRPWTRCRGRLLRRWTDFSGPRVNLGEGRS